MTRDQLLDLLARTGPVKPVEAARALGATPMAARQMLRRLAFYGEVVRDAEGRYALVKRDIAPAPSVVSVTLDERDPFDESAPGWRRMTRRY